MNKCYVRSNFTKLYICFLFVSGIAKSSFGQAEDRFPNTWIGQWHGELAIYSNSQKVKTIPMKLVIERSDNTKEYKWHITYGSDSLTDVRPYKLIVKDDEKGKYLIDEGNGIELEAYLVNEKLICIFEVMASRLVITYSKRKNQIDFEVFSFPKDEYVISGGVETTEGNVPQVKSFSLRGYQYAELKMSDSID